VVLVLGVGLFGLASAGLAAGVTSVLALALWFVAAWLAIGCVEPAEHAAVAGLTPVELRGSAFGLLAAVQSFGNLAASAIAGLHSADTSVDATPPHASCDHVPWTPCGRWD
jgi:MFS family permease